MGGVVDGLGFLAHRNELGDIEADSQLTNPVVLLEAVLPQF